MPSVLIRDEREREVGMGHAAVISALAGEVEEVAADLRVAVPEHWTGKGAESYQRNAINLTTGMGVYAARLHGLAGLVHQHEQEAAAIRSALANGGMVAV